MEYVSKFFLVLLFCFSLMNNVMSDSLEHLDEPLFNGSKDFTQDIYLDAVIMYQSDFLFPAIKNQIFSSQDKTTWLTRKLRVKIFPHGDNRAPHRRDKTPFYIKLVSKKPIKLFAKDKNKVICKSKEIEVNTPKTYAKKIYCKDENKIIPFDIIAWKRENTSNYSFKSEESIRVIRHGRDNNYFYKGQIELLPYKYQILLVNVIDMEKYLAGAVTAEIFITWPRETLAAQIVASRTYAYYQLIQRKSLNRTYDFNDTTDYQVYIGDYSAYKNYRKDVLNEQLKNFDKKSKKYKKISRELGRVEGTIKALSVFFEVLKKTKNQIMLSDKSSIKILKIFQAYFHASGGSTVNASDVQFSGCVPCKGVSLDYTAEDIEKDEFARLNLKPKEFWVRTRSISKLEEYLRKAHLIGQTDNVSKILLSEKFLKRPYRGIRGHYFKIPVKLKNNKQKDINGVSFIISSYLPNIKYKITKKGENYIFKGKGYGHGVGLSQWGAYFKGKKGWDYQKILKYYYVGILIVKIYP